MHESTYNRQFRKTVLLGCIYIWQQNTLRRGVGTGPATAGPMFPEPTIKNIIPLFVIKQIKKFCSTDACLYHFNKGIALLYYRKNKIPIFFKQQLRYKLGACKNNSRSL